MKCEAIIKAKIEEISKELDYRKNQNREADKQFKGITTKELEIICDAYKKALS